MHPGLQPAFGAPVQLGEIGRDAVELDLGQERLLQLTERTLDLAFAFRVPRLARRDLGGVMGGEADRRREQHEPAALRTTEGTHPIRATRRWDPTRGVEEPGDTLRGVVTVLRRREPPHTP